MFGLASIFIKEQQGMEWPQNGVCFFLIAYALNKPMAE